MEIFILTPNGETVKMSTWKTETVIDLKKRISETLFVAPELQSILFHGHVLDDENSVEQFAIEDKSVITLVEGLRGSGIRLNVVMSKRVYLVEIDPTETVLSLKKKIQLKTGIPAEEQRLSFGRIILDDKKRIEQYDIPDDLTICMSIELKGGGLIVSVKTFDGKTVDLDCIGSDTVFDFKKKIAKKLSITPDLQILSYGGRILDDEKKIADFPFWSESEIDLTEAAQILVRTSDGGTFKQEIGGTRTVRDLKRRIGRKLSLTIEELNLVMQDTVLEDDTMIDKLNISEDSVISVHIKKRICFEKDEEKIFLPVGMEETVSDIKRKISEKVESSSDDIQLCYKAGRRLRDDKTLLDNGIEDMSQIRVLFL